MTETTLLSNILIGKELLNGFCFAGLIIILNFMKNRFDIYKYKEINVVLHTYYYCRFFFLTHSFIRRYFPICMIIQFLYWYIKPITITVWSVFFFQFITYWQKVNNLNYLTCSWYSVYSIISSISLSKISFVTFFHLFLSRGTHMIFNETQSPFQLFHLSIVQVGQKKPRGVKV